MERVPMRRGRALSRRVVEVAGVGLVLACVVVGVTVSSAARVSEPVGSGPASHARVARRLSARAVAQLQAALGASMSFAPAPGATQVAPDAPVVVRVRSGELRSVRLESASGATVAGGFVSAQDWQSSGPLSYGTLYRVSMVASGASGVVIDPTMTFQTLVPSVGVTTSVFPSDGLSVGVGQPVVFRFAQPVTDPAARLRVLRYLSVRVSRPVAGGWYWFSDRELHFRPAKFWPAGAQVTVAWNLTGWDAGGGVWGEGQGLDHFAVGDARVSFVNLATDVMTVTDNGHAIATYPVSGGKPTDPTMDGVHIVLDRASVVRMISSSNGIPVNSPDGYDELVYDDVHISDSGEYVHAAPWSVASQGHTNVSHGCINISPANALAFFGFSRVGDVVVVSGSPRPPVVGDHGVMDWDTSWSAFAPAQVIFPTPIHPPAVSTDKSGPRHHL
jgi:lipoprotein-anchoring transpeptidase ErfK/SrfK